MKRTVPILLLTFLASPFCQAQIKSISKSGKLTPKPGMENGMIFPEAKGLTATTGTIIPGKAKNSYTYVPPENLVIPNNMQALVMYLRNGVYHSKSVPVVKKGIGYRFAFAAPDSVDALVMGMVDGDKIGDDMNGLVVPTKEVVDNNGNACFSFYLKESKNGNNPGSGMLSKAILLDNHARRYLDIEPDNAYILKLYEDAYSLNSKIKKQEDAYKSYLWLLYKVKGHAVKDTLLNYAKACLAQNKESKLDDAAWTYRLLQMDEEVKSIENKINTAFPDGERANRQYWDNFYDPSSKKDTTEAMVLASMNDYFARFKNSPATDKDNFYSTIISIAFKKGDWITYWKYMPLFQNQFAVAYSDDKNARQLSGEKPDDVATDLKLAKSFSLLALNSAKNRLDKTAHGDELYDEYQSIYLRYANTYALILYKSGQYDSAFYFQDMVYRLGSHYDVQRIANYALYIEKAKGISLARSFIEENLLKGMRSPTMLEQLQNIYKELGLPDDTFDRMKGFNKIMVKKKYNEAVIAKYGTLKARDFSLKNINGETVSLSSFHNKVAVIDFWATWCVPCRASFPAMQKLIRKYKEDSSVVFLFIDVWENKPFEKMKDAATKVMKDGEYNFTVLLDTQNKAVADYKVMGIPAKFVIDRGGNLVYMGEEISDMSIIIDAAKE